MDTTYTINAVLNARDWNGQHGPMKSYDLTLVGDPRTVELTQKPQTPAPQSGQELTGMITEEFGRVRFKKAKPQQTAMGTNGSRPEDPERNRRIVRQHSQEMALRYCAVKGQIPDKETLRSLVDWFVEDVERSQPAFTPESDVTTPQDTAAVRDASIEF